MRSRPAPPRQTPHPSSRRTRAFPRRVASPADVLARLLAGTGPVLLDFDGPVAAIFACRSARDIVGELHHVLSGLGITPPPDLPEDDPLAVLRWTAGNCDREVSRMVEDRLCAAELNAVRTARPTPFAAEAIAAFRRAGRPVAVVSNNSAPAIHAYLAAQVLGEHVATVIGRDRYAPERMKPAPAPVLAAASALGVPPADCVLVGDSPSDVAAARAAGAKSIGYANKPGKSVRLAAAGADAVVDTMAALTVAIRPPRLADQGEEHTL